MFVPKSTQSPVDRKRKGYNYWTSDDGPNSGWLVTFRQWPMLCTEWLASVINLCLSSATSACQCFSLHIYVSSVEGFTVCLSASLTLHFQLRIALRESCTTDVQATCLHTLYAYTITHSQQVVKCSDFFFPPKVVSKRNISNRRRHLIIKGLSFDKENKI